MCDCCTQTHNAHILTHLHTPLFTDLYLLHTHWVHSSAPGPGQTPLIPKGQPHLGGLQAPGLVTSMNMEGRRGPAGRLERQHASQQAAGGRRAAERPLLAAACGHTRLNRDNGGRSSSPASFPQAQPLVPECPEPPFVPCPQEQAQLGAARGQLKGTSQGAQGHRGTWWPWGMKL